MPSAKSIDTLSPANAHLSLVFSSESKAEKEYISRVPYVSVAGSLIYVMIYTRRDLAHVVHVVTRLIG